MRRILAAAILAVLIPAPAYAGNLEGAELIVAWALPFIGMLLSIALGPLLFAHFWEHHQGKIALFWALLTILPLLFAEGATVAIHEVAHTAILEYLPFILLLLALFTVSGGIVVRGNLHGSPALNTALLAIGTLLASCIGTTGASMVMIRPMLRANDDRVHNVHVFIFFIFLVSNIGGSLTPLGDPPLFLGFLRGVDFFWTTKHLLSPTALVAGILLALFYVMDYIVYKKEGHPERDPTPDNPLRITGLVNVGLLAVVIIAIILSATVQLGAIELFGVPVSIQNILRDGVMLGVCLASLALTAKSERMANEFAWAPMIEVAKLFAAIFITIIPVLAMLKAGATGPFAALVALVNNPDGTTNNAAYFWLTGVLSSFLDNAPTYLVFFELAGGDPNHLMTNGALTLAAISAGAVFMGANSYIGNAPNFMVYAIAKKAGIRMPSFFGYMVWSFSILVPVFVLTTFVFFK
jgi:Na+/H+ antiporter NhaD/arsenite permease-like protein